MKKTAPYLFALIFILQSCSTNYQNFVSPLESTALHYHDIPLQTDSVKKATYFSGVVSFGSTTASNDFFYSFQATTHRSLNLGIIQAYYGAGFSAGSYHFDQFNSSIYPGINFQRLSPKFFGAYGVNAGMNIVFNFGSFEWRALGVEGLAYNEFGQFLNFRKSAPDSTASVRETNSMTKSIGGTTEFLWKRKRGIVFGYKMAVGGFIIASKNFLGIENYERPMYFSNTMHLTKGNVTAFWQLNFGSYISAFQMGVNYRLGKQKIIHANIYQ
jgi:hypothetical protein